MKFQFLNKFLSKKRSLSICLEGIYYLLVVAFVLCSGMLREINLLIMLAGMMIGAMVLNWQWVVRSSARLTISRKLPTSVCAGDLMTVDLTVVNHHRYLDAWMLSVEDCITNARSTNGNRSIRATQFIARVATGQRRSVSFQAKIAHRGRYHFGPIRLSTRFPLGLVRRTLTVRNQDSLVVFPRLGHLMPAWHRLIQAERLGNRQSHQQQGFVDGDFYGLRDWRGGDAKRWIHWRTSARRGTLTVREFERQHSHDLTILLDLCQPQESQPQESPPNDYQQIEEVISFVATATADLCRRGGSSLYVGSSGDTIATSQGSASMTLMREIMEQLALVETDSEDRFPELLSQALGESSSDATIVLVTPRSTDLSDKKRFADIWDDPQKRARLDKVVCVDGADGDLESLFDIETSTHTEVVA